MKFSVYDVNLFWHTGGSVLLGTVAAMSTEDAQTKALRHYMSQSTEHAQEIEDGGSYQIESVALQPDEAAEWLVKHGR